MTLIHLPASLMDFAEIAYSNHDNAHGLGHVIRVWYRALQIITRSKLNLSKYQKKLLPYIIIGHDFRDHKLVETSLSEEAIYNFYVDELDKQSADIITHCHNNCSWSKRKKSIPLDNVFYDNKDENLDILRLILQDADWLDALGEQGLQRCIDYSNSIGKPFPENVKQHILEKLLRIRNSLNFQVSKGIVESEKLEQPLYAFLAS